MLECSGKDVLCVSLDQHSACSAFQAQVSGLENCSSTLGMCTLCQRLAALDTAAVAGSAAGAVARAAAVLSLDYSLRIWWLGDPRQWTPILDCWLALGVVEVPCNPQPPSSSSASHLYPPRWPSAVSSALAGAPGGAAVAGPGGHLLLAASLPPSFSSGGGGIVPVRGGSESTGVRCAASAVEGRKGGGVAAVLVPCLPGSVCVWHPPLLPLWRPYWRHSAYRRCF